MPDAPFALYNPALLDPQTLLSEFTARRSLLETLLKIVRGCKAGHPPQHCLLVGARGMGKTTTLWAVAHSIERDAELATAWQPVVFDEESRRVGDLADFWLEAIRHWESMTEKEPEGRADRLLDEAPADLEDRARQVFLELLEKSQRRAVLLIDNFNELLASMRDDEELHRLRAFLMEDSRVLLIGGATALLDEVTSVDRPFHDFFRLFDLKPLSVDEMRQCLLTLAKTRDDPQVEEVLRKHQGTVEALHLLTGGNPRLVKTFYRLVSEGLQADIRADLERLLDEFTPYFKAIVDALPAQQQRILDAVALAWNPVEVAAVAKTTRLPSNQVSAQIRAMVKTGLLREAAGSPKRKTYLLADRFSNIHYLMRHGRAARNRLEWFVKTLLILFPDEQGAEMLVRLASDSAGCGESGQRDARDLMRSAWNSLGTEAARRALAHQVGEKVWSDADAEAFKTWVDRETMGKDLPEMEIVSFCQSMPADLRERLGFRPQESRWWLKLANEVRLQSMFQLAAKGYRKAIELDPEDTWPWINLGTLQQDHLSQYEEAEASYRRAIELAPKSALPWNGLGTLQQDHLSQYEEAEASYRRAIELDPKSAYPWSGLSQVLARRGDAGEEARNCATRGVMLKPDYPFARGQFRRLGWDFIDGWREVLPAVLEAMAKNPQDTGLYDFAVEGLLQYALLTTPADALAILEQQTSLTPFEPVLDALRVLQDRDHLHKLAPERQTVALRLVERARSKAAKRVS